MSRWIAAAGGSSLLYWGRFPYLFTIVRYKIPISTSCGMPRAIFVLETKEVELICFEEYITSLCNKFLLPGTGVVVCSLTFCGAEEHLIAPFRIVPRGLVVF